MSHVSCDDHPGKNCTEQNPHLQPVLIATPAGEVTVASHVGCFWCRLCKDCHPHECYHDGEPCARCGTSVKDRPLPVFGDHHGMCQPPSVAELQL